MDLTSLSDMDSRKMKNFELVVYLVRHAESEIHLTPNLIGGRSNWAELTQEGVTQSKLLGGWFKDRDVEIEAIYCSPAIRTQQTARYFCESIGFPLYSIELETALIELSQGDWEQKNTHDVYKQSEVIENFDNDAWNCPSGDHIKGESQAMVADRMRKWLYKIIENYEFGNIVVFTHGMAIRCFLADVMNLDKQTAHMMDVPHTSVAVIRIHGGAVSGVDHPNLLIE